MTSPAEGAVLAWAAEDEAAITPASTVLSSDPDPQLVEQSIPELWPYKIHRTDPASVKKTKPRPLTTSICLLSVLI